MQDDIKLLKRALFGNRRERFTSDDPDQLYLFTSDGESNEGPEDTKKETDDEGDSNQKKRSKGRKVRIFPEFFPRQCKEHPLNEDEIPESLRNDPSAKRFFKKVREELEMIPVKLVVIEHFKEVIVREDATGETEIVTAKEPRRLIEGCYAGPSLLALLTTHRFSDHTPYYRGEDILSRMGFRIHRSTQCRWMQRLAVAVGPLVELMQQRMIRSHVLQMDETVIPIVDHDLGRTRHGYLWLAYGDSSYPYNCFWFTATRQRAGPESILADFRGTLLTDAYSGYESIAKLRRDEISWASCAAHYPEFRFIWRDIAKQRAA